MSVKQPLTRKFMAHEPGFTIIDGELLLAVILKAAFWASSDLAVTHNTDAVPRRFLFSGDQNLEAIPDIDHRLDVLESDVRPLIEDRAAASAMRWLQEERARRGPITAEHVERIKALIEEIGWDEARLLATLGAPSIEEIKDFDRVLAILEERRQKQNPSS